MDSDTTARFNNIVPGGSWPPLPHWSVGLSPFGWQMQNLAELTGYI